MENKYPEIERRKFQRAPVNFNVYYRADLPFVIRIQVGDKEFEALAADIGEDGMALLTEQEIPSEESVKVKFNLINEQALTSENRIRAMEIQASVRYKIFVKEKNAFRMGLQFINVSSSDHSFIAHFVELTTKGWRPPRR